MYIRMNVYNTLSKIARRLNKYMSTFFMALGTISIPLAFILKSLNPSDNCLPLISGGIGGLSVILAWIYVNREKVEQRKSQEYLINTLVDIKKLLSKIYCDKK